MCLEELPELSKHGVDEEVIRSVNGSIYLGERLAIRPGRMSFNELVVYPAGEETVSETPTITSSC